MNQATPSKVYSVGSDRFTAEVGEQKFANISDSHLFIIIYAWKLTRSTVQPVGEGDSFGEFEKCAGIRESREILGET